MFLDRRYEDANVVTCGHYFTRISAEIAAWAAEIGLGGLQWQDGGILKVPKLEGPMTLWRAAFSEEFRREWTAAGTDLDPGILLQAWIEQGRARVMGTTASIEARILSWMIWLSWPATEALIVRN